MVVPKRIRGALGLVPGSEFEIVEYGGVIQIRPRGKGVTLEDRGKGFVIVGDGTLTNEMVLELRDMDRR